MNIVVCVKRVPDTAAEKKLDPSDFTLDRENVEAIVNPVDEYGVNVHDPGPTFSESELVYACNTCGTPFTY